MERHGGETRIESFAKYLREGNIQRCLDEAEAAFSTDSGDLKALAYRGIAHDLMGERERGISDLSAAAERAEADGRDDVVAFASHYLGNILCKQGDVEAGFVRLERAADLGRERGDLFTALCQVANGLGRADAAKEWGERALFAKDAGAQCRGDEKIAAQRPHEFDPSAKSRNIIAYSLFGDDPFYRECAITTARQVHFMYPEFTSRFYCSEEVPEPVLRALAMAGAEVKVAPKPSKTEFGALMWRFLAFDDPEASVVMVRDVDSPISPRERAAVDLWLRSDAPFHVIRDDVQHTAPILAGLWGGFTGLLPRLGPRALAYAQTDTSRYCDQTFLRAFVWPRIRDATLAIDSVYTLGRTVDFPVEYPKHGSIHVGCGWTRKQILGPL